MSYTTEAKPCGVCGSHTDDGSDPEGRRRPLNWPDKLGKGAVRRLPQPVPARGRPVCPHWVAEHFPTAASTLKYSLRFSKRKKEK
jgi:hypothetical protein